MSGTATSYRTTLLQILSLLDRQIQNGDGMPAAIK
nr:MAG TPA: hypothetical protein [Caudoviricetes sp.]